MAQRLAHASFDHLSTDGIADRSPHQETALTSSNININRRRRVHNNCWDTNTSSGLGIRHCYTGFISSYGFSWPVTHSSLLCYTFHACHIGQLIAIVQGFSVVNCTWPLGQSFPAINASIIHSWLFKIQGVGSVPTPWFFLIKCRILPNFEKVLASPNHPVPR